MLPRRMAFNGAQASEARIHGFLRGRSQIPNVTPPDKRKHETSPNQCQPNYPSRRF